MSLPEWEKCLKLGITAAWLQRQAAALKRHRGRAADAESQAGVVGAVPQTTMKEALWK